MDVTQALRDTENALRDFIASRLEKTLGSEWIDSCGVTPERVETWRERKAEEQRRQEAGVVDERLLYYADLYDLKTILKKHWQGDFSDALGDQKRFMVFFDELDRFRNPDAHRRELLPHQQQLVLGIAGDIRSRLVRWRSRRETTDDCFPRIESARDSLGNLWVPSGDTAMHVCATGMTLHPGDQVDFVITARDPEDLPLEYGFFAHGHSVTDWRKSGEFSLIVADEHIGVSFVVELSIRSPRPYHARAADDDQVLFAYTVLPLTV
jgi:Swt1-like HEPN